MEANKTTTDVRKEHFGKDGFRLEIFKSGGYAVHSFAGDLAGEQGRIQCVVAHASDYELRRLVSSYDMVIDNRAGT